MINRSFGLVILLSSLGVIVQTLFGAEYALIQLSYLIISITAYLIINKLDTDWLIKLTPLFTGIGISLLLLLLIIADPIRGASRWFVIFRFNFQPSIIFLPFFLLSLAIYLTSHLDRQFNRLLKTLGLILIPTLLVFKQPDLGTAVVIFLSLLSLIYMAGFHLRYFLLLVLALIPVSMFSVHFLKSYQLQRIISFLNPQYDPLGINYNSLQSVIAIGSGHIIGKGFLSASQSKLHFLPEAHTDFVLPVVFFLGLSVFGLLFFVGINLFN